MVEFEEGLPRLGGYGAVNQAGLGCVLGLVLAEKCGVRDPEIRAAVERSAAFFRFFVGKGAIPYGDHPPLWDLHDNNGKNAQAAVAFDLLGDAGATGFFARTALAGYAEIELGHTGNYFGLLWGTIGAARAGDAAAAAHQRETRWLWDLSRRADGGFDYQGAPGESDSYMGWDATGAYVLSLALPRARTFTGGKGRTANPLSAGDVADAVAAGRDCDVREPKRSYVGRTDAELLRGLESWSPTVRHRAATALAARANAETHVPALTKLLGSERMDARYGAAQALELLGKKAAPATDALVAQLNENDVWLRIRTAYALSGIGGPARNAAAEPLLKLAVADDADPRATLRRYLALALFIDGYLDNGPPRGLLVKSVDGVDRPLLVDAVRRMLKLDDGLARSHAANVLPQFDVEEREALWRDLIDAVVRVAPSGEMFAHGVRLAALKLLARHRIYEGMAAAVIYAGSQTSWASEERMGEILSALDAYGAAAKEALPSLRKLEKKSRQEKDFPDDCKAKRTAAVAAAIKRIEAATATPPLRRVMGMPPRREPPGGASGPIKVFVLAGQSNMEGQAVVDLDGPDYNEGRGTYRSLLQGPPFYGRYGHWNDGERGWRTRDDVRVWYRPEGGPVKSGPLGVGFTPYEGKHHFGPELEIGRVLGDAFAEPVLLVKTAWGGKSLRVDFRPPSAGGTVGPYYLKMLEDVRAATADLAALFPGRQSLDFELAGFVWFHGWNDMCDPEAVPEYEANLAHLIADVRRDWKRPNLPVVIGELGNGGADASPEMRAIRAAQRAVAARKELRDTVRFVGTQSFQRKPEDSPNPGHGHHEYGNAETYLLTGAALGEGMRLLLGGLAPD
jgi:HEAT repeat protein